MYCRARQLRPWVCRLTCVLQLERGFEYMKMKFEGWVRPAICAILSLFSRMLNVVEIDELFYQCRNGISRRLYAKNAEFRFVDERPVENPS